MLKFAANSGESILTCPHRAATRIKVAQIIKHRARNAAGSEGGKLYAAGGVKAVSGIAKTNHSHLMQVLALSVGGQAEESADM